MDQSITTTGELHFGWVLGGRAIQDIWIVPGRRFVGRPDGDDILLLSDDEDPQLRWRLTGIEPDSFIWRAETSHDGGTTWHFDEQMIATRTTSSAVG